MRNKIFDEINIGDSASVTRVLTAEDIEIYASAADDRNPTHFVPSLTHSSLDEEKVLGHGMWLGVLLSNIFGNKLPGAGTVYRSQTLEFFSMVALGDHIKMAVKVIEKKAKDNIIVFSCLCTNQNQETVATGTAEVYAPVERMEGVTASLRSHKFRRSHCFFDNFLSKAQAYGPIPVAVAYPCDEVSLRGAIDAAEYGVIDPYLVGPEKKIKAIAEKYSIDIGNCRIVPTDHAVAAIEKSVALCRNQKVKILMKGKLHTDELMSEVIRRETGLRTGRRLSHIFIMDVPSYERMLLITDAAINIYPDLPTKVDILKNSISLARSLGVDIPKVAILSAIETVSPKIQSTLEAAALCKMAERNQIKGAILDGPLAFDNAISPDAAKIKGIRSPVAGEADILLVPNLEAGNMLAKQLAWLADAEMAGVVLGARVPIILTSRSDNARARIASSAVAALYVAYQQEKEGLSLKVQG